MSDEDNDDEERRTGGLLDWTYEFDYVTWPEAGMVVLTLVVFIGSMLAFHFASHEHKPADIETEAKKMAK